MQASGNGSTYIPQARHRTLAIAEKPEIPTDAVVALRQYRELDTYYRRYKLSPENQPDFKEWQKLRSALRTHLYAGELKGDNYEYHMTLEERDDVNDESMTPEERTKLTAVRYRNTSQISRKRNRNRP